MSLSDPNMHFVTHEIPRESLGLPVGVIHFGREALDLHSPSAGFARAAPHYYGAAEHFSRRSPTFRNRGADIYPGGEQKTLAVVRFVAGGCRLPPPRHQLLTGKGQTLRAPSASMPKQIRTCLSFIYDKYAEDADYRFEASRYHDADRDLPREDVTFWTKPRRATRRSRAATPRAPETTQGPQSLTG